MIPIDQTAAVLLCAGLSERFSEGNKLLEPLDGKPLAQHAASLLRSLPFARRIAVTGGDELAGLLGGFEIVSNPQPKNGQDSSVRIGIEAALASRPRAVLICLADMPRVTQPHLVELASRADERTVAMSADDDQRSPPALIPATICERVLGQADQAVRRVLTAGRVVEVLAPVGSLRDFDTREDFAR